MTRDSGAGGANEASGASGAPRIKLKISNFSGGIAPRHPISDELNRRRHFPHVRLFTVAQSNMEEKLIVAVCGHPVLYDTTVFYRDKLKKEEAWVKVDVERAG